MGAEAIALPDRSRAAKARSKDSAGPDGHGTNCRGPAKAVPGIKLEGGRRCCTNSKRICGRRAERAARAASRFPVRAADCLLEPSELVARAIYWQKKRDGGSAGDGRISL